MTNNAREKFSVAPRAQVAGTMAQHRCDDCLDHLNIFHRRRDRLYDTQLSGWSKMTGLKANTMMDFPNASCDLPRCCEQTDERSAMISRFAPGTILTGVTLRIPLDRRSSRGPVHYINSFNAQIQTPRKRPSYQLACTTGRVDCPPRSSCEMSDTRLSQ